MSIKEKTAFVYTLSSRNNMVQQCLRSISTLKHYVEPEKIKIFYTPPYDKQDEQTLSQTGAQIIKKENSTKAFNVSRSQPKRHYSEKTNLCTIEKENIVFLDCDTIIGQNIWEVIKGEFEFKARPSKIFDNQNKEWRELFEKNNEQYLDWMPNAGFMIFKNNFHKEIEGKWRRYVNEDLDFSLDKVDHHEQYALALAVSEGKTEMMSKEEHIFEWQNEKTANGYIYHLQQSSGSSVINLMKNYINKIK